MGNGSPRLHRKLVLCLLPLVAAGLAAAPRTLAAGGLADVQPVATNALAAADQAAAQVEQTAGNPAGQPAAAATTVQDAAAQTAGPAIAPVVRHAIHTAVATTAPARHAVEPGLAHATTSVVRTATESRSLVRAPNPAPTSSPIRSDTPAAAPQRNNLPSRPKPVSRRSARGFGATAGWPTTSRSLRSGSGVVASTSPPDDGERQAPAPGRELVVGVIRAGAADAPGSGVLLAVGMAALGFAHRATGRRTTATLAALRPTPLLLHLERPD